MTAKATLDAKMQHGCQVQNTVHSQITKYARVNKL